MENKELVATHQDIVLDSCTCNSKLPLTRTEYLLRFHRDQITSKEKMLHMQY